MKKLFEYFRKNNEDFLTLLGSLISIYALLFAFVIDVTELQKYTMYIFFVVVIFQFWWLFHRIRNRKLHESSKIQELFEYSKKRKEIDEEIAHLTSALMKSDVGEFIDFNRLAFSGQSNSIYSDAINYDKFLERFGLSGKETFIQKGTAVFLSPFNEEGNKLFQKCQNILGEINVFLQRTDNIMAKDDMLMNIVRLIVCSEVVVVNLNERNMNVYYELGVAHALGKPTVLLAQSDFSNSDFKGVGFDVDHKHIVFYSNHEDLEKKLIIQVSLIRDRK